jgi:hypothetical protein
VSDALSDHELELIEQSARKEGRPEVYGDDAIRLISEIRRLREELRRARVECDGWYVESQRLDLRLRAALDCIRVGVEEHGQWWLDGEGWTIPPS